MVTMSDVAKAAGVSRATASYALRGDPRIVPATAERVMRAARELQYTTNLSARSLRSGRSGIVGVAIFELDHPYPSEMSAAMSREAARHGLETIVQETSNSKDNEVAILQKVTSQFCDGTIFSPGNVSDDEIRAYPAANRWCCSTTSHLIRCSIRSPRPVRKARRLPSGTWSTWDAVVHW